MCPADSCCQIILIGSYFPVRYLRTRWCTLLALSLPVHVLNILFLLVGNPGESLRVSTGLCFGTAAPTTIEHLRGEHCTEHAGGWRDSQLCHFGKSNHQQCVFNGILTANSKERTSEAH